MKFSCVIPTVGGMSLSLVSLPSVLGQVRKFDEVVVVNDGLAALESLSGDRFSEIRVVQTSGKQGGLAARRLGFCNCESEYVVFLDDDDELDKNFLASLEKIVLRDINLDIILPYVKKRWPQLLGLSLGSGGRNNRFYQASDCQTVVVPTFSGVAVRRGDELVKYMDPRVPAFQDYIFVREALKNGASVAYYRSLVVNFNQVFSAARMTSKVFERVDAIKYLSDIGYVFSHAEEQAIIASSFFAHLRTTAYIYGARRAVNELERMLSHSRIRDAVFSDKLVLLKHTPFVFLALFFGCFNRFFRSKEK